MTDDRSFDERLEAVERAVSDGHAEGVLPEAARVDSRLEEIETAVNNLDDRLAELEAAVQALRGFAGGVRAVDESVERRANAAIARVERLESEVRGAGSDARSADPYDESSGRSDATADGGDGGAGVDSPYGSPSDVTGSDDGRDPERDVSADASTDAPTDATLAAAAAANAADRMVAVDEVGRDGETERLGRDERVSFRTRTVLAVAVPPSHGGVGDVDGNADERSGTWPRPDCTAWEAADCPDSE